MPVKPDREDIEAIEHQYGPLPKNASPAGGSLPALASSQAHSGTGVRSIAAATATHALD
jgi:hypothetical protein